MKKIDIPLGSTVRDRVTNFVGFAVARLEYMNNCLRFEVQPPVKDGELPEPKVFDGSDLEIVSPPKADLPPAVETPNKFRLGVKVKDVLTGFTGVAVVRAKHWHSGDRYAVQAPLNKKGEVPKMQFFDEEDPYRSILPSKSNRRKKAPNRPTDPTATVLP